MKSISIFFVFITLCFTAGAQQKPPASSATAGAVKLVSRLGNIPAGNTGAEVLKRIVDSSLNVVDAKGNKYAVVSFTVNYMFMSSFAEEGSEEKKSVKDLRSIDFFDTNKLSADWAESIKDNVQVNDELLINKVVVRGKNGKKMFAPDAKYKVMF